MPKSLFTLLTFYCLITSSPTNAQTHIGLRADIGNPLNYSPTSTGFETPSAISGSLLINYHQLLNDHWTFQYEAELGVLGYRMKVISIDTLADPDPYPFSEYATFRGGLSLSVFRGLRIKDKYLMIGLGGGASYYYSFFPVTTYGITIISNNTDEKVFAAEIHCPTNNIVPFATFAAQLSLTRVLSIRASYSHYFNDVLAGTFEFYHTPTPTRGEISMRPRELGVAVLFRIGNQ